jgi:acetylglutamate kinase
MAGATAGLLDGDGTTIPVLEAGSIAEVIDRRTATAGMIAKLRACEQAIRGGVGEVLIVDGRSGDPIRTAIVGNAPAAATQIVTGSRVQV